MKLRVLLVAMCVALLVVPAAFAELSPTLSLSGDVETNTTLFGDDTDRPEVSQIVFDNDGRVLLNIEGMIESDSGFFAGAKAQPLFGTSGIATVDDAWVSFGKGIFDFKLGRYEYEGLYSKGNDILLVTPLNIPGAYYRGRYEGNYARGRFSGGIDNVGLTWNGEMNFFQLGFVYGGLSQTGPTLVTTTDPDTGVPIQTIIDLPFTVNAFGFRPVYKYTGDALTFKVGFDYLSYFPQDDNLDVAEYTGSNDFRADFIGFAGDLQWQFGGASKAGLALAYGATGGKTVDGQDQDETGQFSSFLWLTLGVREADELGFGFGYQTQKTNYNASLISEDASGINWEGYISYIQQLPVESLKAKYAFAYASTTADPGNDPTFTSNRWGFRLRLNYDF